MKKMMLITILALVGIFLLTLNAQATAVQYHKGDVIQDFTFTTYDGQQNTLYEVLKEKDAVLLNIWASWCGPCKREFPFMQEAYTEYSDHVEIVALSCEATDTPEKLASFADENGLSFLIGQAPNDLLNTLNVSSIPVSLMIDRNGTICFMEAGAQPDTDAFRRLFEVFLGDDYSEAILLDTIPADMPDIMPSDESQLAAAIGNRAINPTSKFTWPMVVTEKDGRTVLTSTNAGKASSRAEVTVEVDANAGEAIQINFKTSTEPVYDLMTIAVNGKTVKSFGGDHDWMTYAVPVDTDGKQFIKISYSKDRISDAGNDTIWLDSVSVVEDAQTALSENPLYPISADTGVVPIDSTSREVIISDPHDILAYNFGQVRCFVVNADAADVRIELSADVDPECALVYFSYNKAQIPVTQIMEDDGYYTSTTLDSIQTTGAYCTFAAVYPDVNKSASVTTLLFRDEDNLESFVARNSLGGWEYLALNVDEQAIATPAQSTYTIICSDPNGEPIAGAVLQVCNDDVCQVYVTDQEGTAVFETDPYPWEIHVLQAPAGYIADPSHTAIAPVEGGEITLILNHE